MLFVWDGTDAPPVNIHTKLDEEFDNPLPLQLEPIPLSRNVLTYEERAERKWDRKPFMCLPWPSKVTDTEHQDVPFVTLMDVLTASPIQGCVVRVVATLPDHPRDFKAPCGTYRIRLTLEDPTARIHVYIYAEDGVKFFGGYPSIDMMIKKHNALLGVEETKCRFR
ncbi:putative protection of telomeres protein [Helianthus anomalus]